jgi:hypothetical protein
LIYFKLKGKGILMRIKANPSNAPRTCIHAKQELKSTKANDDYLTEFKRCICVYMYVVNKLKNK